MKKIIILGALIAVLLFTMSAGAVDVNSSYGQKLLKAGYTENDIMAVNAIIALTDENVPGFVINKYDELGDWERVLEHYGIDEKDYKKFTNDQRLYKDCIKNIPESVTKEMKDAGWSSAEITNFMNRINISKIDAKYAWNECKKGKSIEELHKEKEKISRQIADLGNKLIWGNFTEKEYRDELQKIAMLDTAEIDSITEKTKLQKQKVINSRIKESGLSDKEIEFCKKNGLTNVMDMCTLKNMSKRHGASFEKLVNAKAKRTDWEKAKEELLGAEKTKME